MTSCGPLFPVMMPLWWQVPVPVLLPQQRGRGGGLLPAVPPQLGHGGHLGPGGEVTQHIVHHDCNSCMCDCARQGAGVVPPSVILVGTKLDLVEVGCRREVTEQEARTKADTLGALYTGQT